MELGEGQEGVVVMGEKKRQLATETTEDQPTPKKSSKEEKSETMLRETMEELEKSL